VGVIIAVALAASAVASLATPGAAQAVAPDAYCPGPPTSVADRGGSAARFAQTFSPINGGYLTAVRFFVDEQGHGGDYLVQITPVSGSNVAPTDPLAVLAQATIADASIPISPVSHGSEVEADFANPPAILVSSEYAIVVKRPGDSNGLGLGYVGNGSTGDPCPFGGLYASPDDSTPWIGPLTGDDAVFSTFMNQTPTPIPPADPTGQRAAALKKCKKKHSHKAKKKCKKKASLLPV
jgi:hypothetical protein